MPHNQFEKYAKGFAEYVYDKFRKNSGSMLLMTSAIGVALSSLAQAAAAILNDKYTVSQKAFMVPQELTEGVVSVMSLFVVTIPIQMFAGKYAKTGKIMTSEMKSYMKKYNLMQNRGKTSFDFSKSVNKIMHDIEKTTKFKKSNSQQKDKMLKEHIDILQKYDANLDATLAISTACGSVFTTALVLPYVRNLSASYYQKLNMQQYNKNKNYRPIQPLNTVRSKSMQV